MTDHVTPAEARDILNPPPDKSHRGLKTLGWVGTVFAALFIGMAVGASEQKTDQTAPEQVASRDCLYTLDKADELISLASQGFGIMANGFISASSFDVDGINQATAEMDALNPQIGAARSAYDQAAAACRN